MNDSQAKPLVGVSSCLMGNEVRFDGGHKHNAYVTKTLADHFEFRSLCPEQAIGLPTPRPPIRLVAPPGDEAVRAVGVRDPSEDFTSKLDAYGDKMTPVIREMSGFVVKKDSPSCGMERVKVYEKENAPAVRRGSGLFIARVMKNMPELPVEEEGRLMDPRLRENFITRVFTMSRWRDLTSAGITAQRLVEFHTRHKFLLLAHHEATYRELGRLIANVGKTDLDETAGAYIALLMSGLKQLANPKKHANVLMHIMGYVKDHMTADEKAELLDLIEAHRTGLVPVIVPITLLNHFLRRFPNEYIADQYYLTPHPRELMLRNSI